MKRPPRVRVSRRLALTVAVALVSVGLVASLSVASAARLEVRVAGPLQVMVYDVEPPDVEPPTEHTITVIARRFNSGQGNDKELGSSPEKASVSVPHGQSYALSWTGGSVVSCSSVSHLLPTGHVEEFEGTHEAMADTTYEFCVQTKTGEMSITTPAETS